MKTNPDTTLADRRRHIGSSEVEAVFSPKLKSLKDWKCQECMTLKAAEKAMSGSDGCPKCGGSDIDLAEV